jgi:hypothetical protein
MSSSHRNGRGRGGKTPGYEFWSKRPCSMMGHGPDVKQMTKDVERMRDKSALRKEIDTMDNDWNKEEKEMQDD